MDVLWNRCSTVAITVSATESAALWQLQWISDPLLIAMASHSQSQQTLITTVPMAKKEITVLLAYVYWEWVKSHSRRFSLHISNSSNNQICIRTLKTVGMCGVLAPEAPPTTHNPTLNTHTHMHFEEGNKYLARTMKKRKKTEDGNDQSRMKEGILQLKLQNTKGRGNLKELNHKRMLWTT